MLGRNWLQEIKVDWTLVKPDILLPGRPKEICHLELPSHSLMTNLKTKYAPVFEQKPGEIKSKAVNIVLKENSKPVFCKELVPFALREAVQSNWVT